MIRMSMMMTLKIENYIFPCQAAPRPPRQGEWPGQALLDPCLPSKKPTTKAIYDLQRPIFHGLILLLWPTLALPNACVYSVFGQTQSLPNLGMARLKHMPTRNCYLLFECLLTIYLLFILSLFLNFSFSIFLRGSTRTRVQYQKIILSGKDYHCFSA